MTASPSGSWPLVERRAIVAPLGIRFWDPAFDVQVSDGLTVIAYPEGTRRLPTTAFCTPGGVFAFRGLAGLHDVEYPTDDPTGPGSLPTSARFLVEVTDGAQRFIPLAFLVDAPFKGIFPTDLPIGPNAVAPPGFYLFSAPTRSGSPLLALVRAQVNERLGPAEDGPAAYAVMELDAPDGTIFVGLADASGAISLLFPYPTFTFPTGDLSLPAPPGPAQQSWPITLRIRYQPSALSFPAGTTRPELRSVLAQAPATIWTQRLTPPGQTVPALQTTLVYGQELVLRSGTDSVLLISLGSTA